MADIPQKVLFSRDSEVRQDRKPYEPKADAEDLSPSKDRAILKEIKVPGIANDKPGSQDRVQVHYTGYFPDGKVFDTSRDRRSKFEFTLGRGNVIKAWDIGIASMTKGEIATIYCKPEYGYGKEGNPPSIPSNADLVFEVELFDWKGEDLTKTEDGGITRQQLVKGTGYSSPKEGTVVEIHIVGRYNGKVFVERDVNFALGEGAEHGLPEGIEIALEKFHSGEKSVITLKPKYAFGSAGSTELDIPPNATIDYEITLIRFEKGKEIWEMDTKEKLEQTSIFKNKGTEYLQVGKYELAVKQYKKIISYLENEMNIVDKGYEHECQQMLISGHLNLALCYLKMDEYVEARYSCVRALEIDPVNEKALFRSGQAYMGTCDFELSLQKFKHLLRVYPNNKAAANQIILCNNKMKEASHKDKEIYGNMFAKFAAKDEMREKERYRQQPDVLNNPGTWEGKHQPNLLEDNPLSNVQMIGDVNESLWS